MWASAGLHKTKVAITARLVRSYVSFWMPNAWSPCIALEQTVQVDVQVFGCMMLKAVADQVAESEKLSASQSLQDPLLIHLVTYLIL